MKKLLLLIKSGFALMGIEIRFIKKQPNQSAFELNNVDIVNKAWSDKNIAKKFLSKAVQEFYSKIIDKVTSENLNLANKSIVDVGCGNGMLLKYILDRFEGVSVVGLEYSEAALQVAKNVFPEANYILYDLTQHHDQQYEVVFCTEVLEHVPDPELALKNLIKMIAPGGFGFISVPDGRLDTFIGHINFWSPESWQVFIEKHSGPLSVKTGKLTESINFAILRA